MINRTTRLRWRRRFRRSKHQVEDIGVQAEQQLERHLIRRIGRLESVRRFVIGWVALLILLVGVVILQNRSLGAYYLTTRPASGGIYTEGLVGTFTNANPLFATGNVDSSVARLLFAGLFKYDQSNKLIGDLATKYEVDEKGVRYTVHLKPNLKWHDGKPLTAEDVVFTYQTIQNPDTKSPLLNSWAGVKVEASDSQTVSFTLPNSLSAFPYSLTNGIVPKHLLSGIPLSQLRAVSFNTNSPIGSGPFVWQGIDVAGDTPESRRQNIAMTPFSDYHESQPRLSKLVLHAFHEEKPMLEEFKKKQLSAIAGMESMPDELTNELTINQYDIPLTSQVMVFFKNTNEILQDMKVRQALIKATDTKKIVNDLSYPAIGINQPLLKSQLGYNHTLQQFSLNTEEAKRLLEEANWKSGPDGIRFKDNKPLTFKLFSKSNSEYANVSQLLQKQWRAVGVDVEVILQDDSDLQSTISFHNYDALLYGISVGVDPDVFAFWHSTQADPRAPNRLNFSEYKSVTADKALEGGRTRSDANLRGIKYMPFLESWRNDVPAIALYQPRFLYVTQVPIAGFKPNMLNSGADRFNNVSKWMIREEKVPITAPN